ncbi:MAG: hypothetical protein V4813_13085 [Gemmatimonadota bacterium]
MTTHEGHTAAPNPARIKPQRSVKRAVGHSDSRPFSSFDDYAEWVVALGRAECVADVRTKHKDLWGALLMEWYAQGQLACVFAQVLARNMSEAEIWPTVVVSGSWTAEMVTATVDAAAEEGAEVIQLLFACEGTVEDAISITTRLAAHPRWASADRGWLEGESGDSVQIGLQWISSDNTYESWVLGIAPFETMPFTRRWIGAPFIALVLRPTPPATERAEAPIGDSGLPSAHLAHVDDTLGADSVKRLKWTEGTRRAKRALISPDPLSRARAKVTFALPAWAGASLINPSVE